MSGCFKNPNPPMTMSRVRPPSPRGETVLPTNSSHEPARKVLAWRVAYSLLDSPWFFFDIFKLFALVMMVCVMLLGMAAGLFLEMTPGEFIALLKPLGLVFVGTCVAIWLALPWVGGATHLAEYTLSPNEAVMRTGSMAAALGAGFKTDLLGFSGLAAWLTGAKTGAAGRGKMRMTNSDLRLYQVEWKDVQKVAANRRWMVVTLYRRKWIWPLLPIRMYCPDRRTLDNVLNMVKWRCPGVMARSCRRLVN